MIVRMDFQHPYYRLLTLKGLVALAFEAQCEQEVLRSLQRLCLHALKMSYLPGEMFQMP